MGWFMALSTAGKVGAGVVALALLAGVFFGVRAWVDSIRQEGRDEISEKWRIDREAREEEADRYEKAVATAMKPEFAALNAKLGGIDQAEQQITVQLPRAIAAAPRYADPNCSLTAPVLESINAARALSAEAQP